MNCPRNHGKMYLRESEKTVVFRGKTIRYLAEYWVCPVCGIEAGTIEQTGKIQERIWKGYCELKEREE